MEIKYLKHNQIDKQKWDATIENAQNGFVYVLSWFLDIVSPQWDAIVSGDYSIIMPLTYKKKFYVKYLYQPIFIQQLGIFSSYEISEKIIQDFIAEANKHFKYIDIQLNYANPKLDSENFILRNTQSIDVSSYDDIFKKYKKNHKKNLQKINVSELIINSTGGSNDFIELMGKMFVRKGVEEITSIDLENLKKVIDHSIDLNLGQFYFGYLNNAICAAAFFLKWKKRVILFTALNEQGREISAMYGLIDKYLKENSGKDLLFDFAGSNIPGVKYRNLGFGARNEIYYRLKINNLPIPLRWIKK